MTLGSSPLARGTFTTAAACTGWIRLIPARAGNILRFPIRPPRSAAHPRSRGEHVLIRLRRRAALGSSPLARGTSDYSATITGTLRLIPARAGNIQQIRKGHHIMAAHPRSRGEHNLFKLALVAADGSSPLARGTSSRSIHPARSPRLIPARAGNIRLSRTSLPGQSAHPRSRGEHL